LQALVSIEHSLTGTDSWKPRSTLTYSVPKLVTAKSKRLVSLQVEQITFSQAELTELQKLVDAGRMYRLRVPSDINDINSPKVIASIHPCLLIASKFHEMLRVQVDQFGYIRGLWYKARALDCPTGPIKVPPSETPVITSISVDMEVRGPKLPSEPVTQADKSEEQMKHEETKSQTFVSKYWYYIVGGVLLISLMGPDESPSGKKESEAGGGGNGQRRA
jgi:hypothetical protein